MAKILQQLIKLSTGILEKDETLLAGLRVNLKRLVAGITAASLFGAPGILVGSSIIDKERKQSSENTGVELTPQMAFGLTNKRLLLWKRSQVSGKPTELIG